MNVISWQQSLLSAAITLVIGGLFVTLVIRSEGRTRSEHRSGGLPNQAARTSTPFDELSTRTTGRRRRYVIVHDLVHAPEPSGPTSDGRREESISYSLVVGD